MASRCAARRRARRPSRSPPHAAAAARTHLVAGCDHASGVTLGQVAYSPEAGKGGEVAAAKQLAATLDERGLLADSVITVDTGFTAGELATDQQERGAHWIVQTTGNQKTLHSRLKALPWAEVPEAPGSARSATAGSRPAPSASST